MPKKTKLSQNEPVTVQLKKFDINSIKDNKIIVFIGKRNTGKSILVIDYLYHHRTFPLGTVISPTDNYNFTYRPHIPSIFIHDEYTPELLEQILERQKSICQSCKTDEAYADVDPRAFVVLDDCLADGNEWVKDRNIKWIFMNGRHAQITFILTMQYCMGITPNLRTNVDYIFICKETKLGNMKRLYEHYAGMFPCFEMFRVVLNKCTKNYGCLVIDNSSNSDKIEEQVYWYRSDLNKPDWDTFKLCYPIFWKNNEVFLAGKDKKKEDNIDFSQLGVKKNQHPFNVKQLDKDT
jgi:hypothetical protein